MAGEWKIYKVADNAVPVSELVGLLVMWHLSQQPPYNPENSTGQKMLLYIINIRLTRASLPGKKGHHPKGSQILPSNFSLHSVSNFFCTFSLVNAARVDAIFT